MTADKTPQPGTTPKENGSSHDEYTVHDDGAAPHDGLYPFNAMKAKLLHASHYEAAQDSERTGQGTCIRKTRDQHSRMGNRMTVPRDGTRRTLAGLLRSTCRTLTDLA